MVDDSQPVRRRTRRGAMVGMVLGACGALAWIASVVNSIVDPNVSEHKGIYPFAVLLVCAFCVFVLIVSVGIGSVVGAIVGSLLSRWRSVDPDA
jgi:hypothetical protein